MKYGLKNPRVYMLGMGGKDMSKKDFLLLLIAATLLGTVPYYNASANSVKAVLNTDETSKSTPYLGNATGKYCMVYAVSSTSDYNVEYYVYKAQNSDSTKTLVSCFAYGAMKAEKNYYTIDKKVYTVAKCTMYGNKKSNPKKECYANVILSNY